MEIGDVIVLVVRQVMLTYTIHHESPFLHNFHCRRTSTLLGCCVLTVQSSLASTVLCVPLMWLALAVGQTSAKHARFRRMGEHLLVR